MIAGAARTRRPRRLVMRAAAGALALATAASGSTAGAQDFASPWTATEPSVAVLLEHGIPAAATGVALELIAGRWLGIAGVETRALALGGGWRSARAGVGLSQTGDAELGWTAAALAAGFARRSAGAAARLAGRRDRAGDGEGLGAEAGGGAWLSPAAGLRLWASAPQLWVDGAAPPLARGLAIGVAMTGDEFEAWLSRESARPGGETLVALHAAGLTWRSGALRLSVEARDRPLRGALALGARAGPVGIASRIESHPLAGETTHLAVRLGGGAP